MVGIVMFVTITTTGNMGNIYTSCITVGKEIHEYWWSKAFVQLSTFFEEDDDDDDELVMVMKQDVGDVDETEEASVIEQIVEGVDDDDLEDLYPIQPSFEFIESTQTREMIESAYTTITRLEKWHYLRDYVVDENTGFTQEPSILDIMNKINDNYQGGGHSGGSMGFTMRAVHDIAKQGFPAFTKKMAT